MPALRGGEGGGHKREGRGGKEGGIGLKRQREETETAVNARGFGEVGDSEACELAVNPVRAGASSQRAPFSHGRGKKKKRTPYRAMETARNGAAMPPKPRAAAS